MAKIQKVQKDKKLKSEQKKDMKKAAKEKWDSSNAEDLFRAILTLENTDEAKRFFRDLLTAPEIMDFSQRWKTARLLDEGTPYLEIGRQTWMSSKTIARIQRWLKRGKGGYRLVLDRMKRSEPFGF